MRLIPTSLALAALLSAAIAPAAPQTDRPVPADRRLALVERLFPETAIEGEGWRGLLPILLMNHELQAQRPLVRAKAPATATR